MNCGHLCVALVVTVAGSCIGELSIPVDARLTCVSAEDCPADLVCNLDAGLCVPPGTTLDLVAPIVVSTAVDVARIGPGASATVTITADEAIGTATVVDETGVALALIISDKVVSVVIAAEDRTSGPVSLTVEWADVAGNSRTSTIASGVFVDVDAPLAIADNTIVNANGNTNVLSPASPAAARADSGATISFGFDEFVVNATAARLVPFEEPDDAGFAFADDVVVTIGTTGTNVTITVPVGGLGDVDEGAWLVALDVQDDLGNVGSVVGTVPLVVDTTPPSPPILAVVRRAPFGSGDSATASTSLAGTAVGAVLVLAVPGSVVVDNESAPPLVGRREPDALGAFELEVPLDIEALRVVAVDEAGNLSVPASPARIELVASVLATTTPHRVFERQVSDDVLVQRADRFSNDALRAGPLTTTAAPTWTPLTTIVHEQIREAPILANDPVSGGTLAVIGGDTFRLRGNQFERLNVPRLPVVKGYGMATDVRRGVVVLFGGDDADGDAVNSLFEWNGERWRERLRHDPTATDRPSPRVGAGVAYSQTLGGVAVVNGCAEDAEIGIFGCVRGLVPEVWVWDGDAFDNRCAGDCGTGPFNNRPELTVDGGGALVATGGFVDFGEVAFVLPSPPQVFTFDGARWVGRCEAECADALPANRTAYFDTATGTPAFFGTCADTACTARLNDDDTIVVANLVGSPPSFANDKAFQQRPFVAQADGRLVFVVQSRSPAALGSVLAVQDNRFGVVVPSLLTPRCGSAVVDLDGEAAIVGGCDVCGLDRAPAASSGACSGPSARIEVPGHAGVDRGTGAAAGLLRRVDAAAGPQLVRGVVDQSGSGAALLFDALDLAAVPTVVELGPGRSLEGAFALTSGAIALIEVQFDPADAVASISRVNDLRAFNGSVLQTVCADCGVGGGIFGLAVAGGSAGGVVFGGDLNGRVSDVTTRIDGAGVVRTSPLSPPSPPSRRFANALFDDASDATWLFGGMSQPELRTGNDIFDCGVAGSLAQCGDLWRLDSDRWQQIQPADVSGFGRPQPRYNAAFGAVAGKFVLAGGRGPDPTSIIFADHTLDDAWVLDAAPSRVPSHLIEVALTPYGADADGEPSAVAIEWCGTAFDAVGAAPVETRIWVGGGWRTTSLVADDGCAHGEVDLSDVGDVVVRDSRLFVEVRPTNASSTGPGVALVTTTAITVTAIFSP